MEKIYVVPRSLKQLDSTSSIIKGKELWKFLNLRIAISPSIPYIILKFQLSWQRNSILIVSLENMMLEDTSFHLLHVRIFKYLLHFLCQECTNAHMEGVQVRMLGSRLCTTNIPHLQWIIKLGNSPIFYLALTFISEHNYYPELSMF